MTAAARADLVRIAHDVRAQEGDDGARRGAALARALAGATVTGLGIADLTALPAWQRGSREAQTMLARRAALVSMAPALAASIDGAWLGALAGEAGADAVDAAIGSADAIDGAALPPVAADRLDARGFALLRATLPAVARRLMAWAPDDDRVDPAAARTCVALAQAMPA